MTNYKRLINEPKGFDGTFYPDGMEAVPKSLFIVHANKKMIDNSDYLISYSHSIIGNTYKFVEYAGKKKVSIKITLL